MRIDRQEMSVSEPKFFIFEQLFLMKFSEKNILDQRWQKAAILGSVWASVEIVIGSFLHNMKFPLTGTILSAIGVALLIAGHSLWKEKGIVWRAGIICAIMKSVSPSSVILGPMIGITVEAFIVELFIRLTGGNLIGYVVGGAIACTTPLIQKTISYLFVYGMDIAATFVRLIEFASKYLNMPSLQTWHVIIVVIGINLFLGGLSAIVGLVVGKRAKIFSLQHQKTLLAVKQSFNHDLTIEIKFSIILLLLHLIILVLGLIIQSPVFLLYISFCIYHYPQTRKRFRKISFWIEIGIISLIAGIVIGEFSLQNRIAGITIGIQMFARALFVVSIFSAIAVELRNPVIVRYLFRQRLKNLTMALDAAFEALPTIIDSLQREKEFFKHPIDTLARILAGTDQLLHDQNRSIKIFVITGEKDSGKTRFVNELLTRLQSKGIAVAGIVQNKIIKNDERYGYDLYDVQSQQTVPLCRTDAVDEDIIAGPFKFFSEAIRFGNDALSITKVQESGIVIIDEVGPLEMKGKGWASALEKLIEGYTGTLILIVRDSLTEDIFNKFQFTPKEVWNIKQTQLEDAMKYLLPQT